MSLTEITIRGARTHNLKNVDLTLPRDKLVVITGLSGSGKSSLAFDTIYAEGQRRYVESLSAYARQFLSMMEKPDVDSIEGLSPAISIEQKSTSHNPRSTVGTVTEIYDYLRLLYARVGIPSCPDHGGELIAQTVQQMVDKTLEQDADTAWMLLAPVVVERKGEHRGVIDQLKAQGFIRARIDGAVTDLEDAPELEPKKKHTIEAIVDRFKIRDDMKQRLSESFETALNMGSDVAILAPWQGDGDDVVFSARYACKVCGWSIGELEPRMFSFNNPTGACASCDGLGTRQVFDEALVVAHPDASLADGAIRGWDRRNYYYFALIQSLAEHYEFDADTVWDDLAPEHREVILRGSGRHAIDFTYPSPGGKTRKKRHRFEGILPNMERRYRETESMAVREELAKFLSNQPCPSCNGDRLNSAARNVLVAGKPLPEITRWAIRETTEYFAGLSLPGNRGEIASRILKEISERLTFLMDVGLDYLQLGRSADTLSGGEAQRIRLASQIGAGLVGVMYVLDEPSIGLHQRDNQRLLGTLFRLRDLGNTVLVVEHDEDAIRQADHVIDIGPGPGVHGGTIVAQGTPRQVENTKDSITGQYLSGKKAIAVPEKRNAPGKQWLTLKGATGNNLQNVTAKIPLGLMTCVTGVSGSGKSTLVNETLYKYAARTLNRASAHNAPLEAMQGLDQLDKVIEIDQSPIGRTPRSNPATYTGLFTPIRDLFSQVPRSRERGYKPGRFSFNVKGGRCEACQGDGVLKVEMHFLPDIYVPCDVCNGARYNRETLEIHYKGKSIADVLNMTVEEGQAFFAAVPKLARKLDMLMEVGLSYITLGQNATTLSGGEAQRVKLARELSKRDTGQTLYILDEPTTGLHFADIAQLLTVLDRLRDAGNTVVVIEHNLDVIKRADWLIDMGPEGGSGGGMVVAEGTPEDVASVAASYTGQFLRPLLGMSRSAA